MSSQADSPAIHQGAAGARRRRSESGRAQLSLVEHALCPLDSSASLVQNLVHEATYGYTDGNGHAKRAEARVHAPFGLSANDEFVLWGLLALTFAQPDSEPEFQATPHYCLRRLGVISEAGRKGGKEYRLFRASVRRLAGVLYESNSFYDPVRQERRDVAFGLLKYSLPLDDGSSRAWRFIWDTQFFEICAASGGSLGFDLQTYRSLDPASRRLFVLLQKVFWRQETSPSFEVRHLAIDVLGFAASMPVNSLKARLVRSVGRLLDAGIIRLPPGVCDPKQLFVKRGVGQYALTFHRGPYFERAPTLNVAVDLNDSPLVEPLRSIGFDDAAIRRLLARYKPRLLREWADITLAARERNGDGFFKRSAAAYFLDNVKHAASGNRTPPDWWRQLRVEEFRKEQGARSLDGVASATDGEEAAFRRYLETEAKETYVKVLSSLRTQFADAGTDPVEAQERAERFARTHLKNRFRHDYPQWSSAGPDRVDLAELISRRRI